MSYFNEKQNLKRPHITLLLDQYDGFIKFSFCPVVDVARISDIERELITALIPPLCKNLPAKVSAMARAFADNYRNVKMCTELNLPALRGIIGDWVYYVTLLPFLEVRKRIQRNRDIHETQTLEDWLQRDLTDRGNEIADYLATQKQCFFNGVVVGVYGGEPQWYPLSLQPSAYLDPLSLNENVEAGMGILKLTGDEKLFAIDGQHRVEGVKRLVDRIGEVAFEERPDELCAIFVAHKQSAAGMQRSRRLFSTLNKYAKPVSLTELIILDEDDIVAITCRRLIESILCLRKARFRFKNRKPSILQIVAVLHRLLHFINLWILI